MLVARAERMTTTGAGAPQRGEVTVKVTVCMGIDKLWVRADVELHEYDDTHQGAIITHALTAAGDQAIQQLRDLSAAKTAE